VFGTGGARKTVTESDTPETGTWVCELVVQNTGVVHVPLEIELKFADGSTQRLRWDDRGTSNWSGSPSNAARPWSRVWLDPEGKIALDNPTTHHYRLDPDIGGRAAGQRVGRLVCTDPDADRGALMPRLGLGDLVGAGPKAVSRYTGTLLAVFVAQSIVAAICIIAVAVVLAQAFAHLPMFDEAVDGDLVALIYSLGHGKPSMLAAGGIVFSAVALWQLASWFLVGGNRRRARAAPRGSRRHGAVFRRERRSHLSHVREARAVLAPRLGRGGASCSSTP